MRKIAEGADVGRKTRSLGVDTQSVRSLLDTQASGYTSLKGEVWIQAKIKNHQPIGST